MGSVIVVCELSCSSACGKLPKTGIKTGSPALAGGLPTTGLPGKSNTYLLSTGYVTSSMIDAVKLRYKSVINFSECCTGTFNQVGKQTQKNIFNKILHSEVQFSSVAYSCPTLCDPMNPSTPGFPVSLQHPEFTQTHAH